MKKVLSNKILIGSYFFIIYLFFGYITWGEHTKMLFLTLISTFGVAYFVFKKIDFDIKTILVLILPFTIILLIACIASNDFSRGLLYIIFVPLSCYLAFLTFKFKYIFIPFFSILLFGLISFYLFPNYFIYYQNHDAEKNIMFSKIDLVNSKNEVVNLKKEKIIVLDFWSTSCGICFKKFPDLESIYNKYKDNKNIEIISINVPIENDKFEKTIKILDSIGYTFPKLYAKSFKQVETNLKFNTFPHLMIIKDNKIRYDGFLITNNESKLYNIDDEIEKLLNE